MGTAFAQERLKVVYGLYRRRKTLSRFYSDYEERFKFAREYAVILSDLELPLDIGTLKNNAFLNPLLIAMGHFVKEYQNRFAVK